MSVDRRDYIEHQGGVVHLQGEFREVARLANRAGLNGYEVVDVELGLDIEEVRAALAASPGVSPTPAFPPSRILITYRKLEASK